MAALEFAIIMPILVLFMLAGAEAARFIYMSRSITNLAYSLATRVAERTTAYNFNDAVFDYYSTVVTTPFLLGDSASRGTQWNFDVALTMSSIIFTPTKAGCTSNCAYTAKVAWSVNSPIAGQRSCTVPPTAQADTVTTTLTTLPQDIYAAGSIIVADVVYAYTPIFGSKLIPAVTIRRSYFMQPRYQFPVPYTSSGFDAAYVCS
ncbi:TadE/TadG family type IV pilus assembly protein [Beijerinckia sp. L45]|uniref:TadE/TadG family type IV pilus assembly protein n=1 Tax=Beijerinckia sp. L45 TaxID=1641855 RepID=UPI00131D8370|nr:TadE/TadG family type IV pilus assembly protein [Beijerinckia sp. L45]